ncbi:MAG TPA: hypothetical protein VM573_09020 [Actinomycetota bacterium]|jgi:hypothetical protein|nr:hypothetical protein [Actinomycetota bacterium]
MRTILKRGAGAALASALAVSLVGLTGSASADAVSSARGAAFGLELVGPVGLEPQPAVEAVFPAGPETAEDALLEVPADPAVNSATLAVRADAAQQSTIEPTLQAVIEGQFSGAPATWNARGYAITEDLAAVSNTITADVIESESTAACIDGDIVYGSAARIVNLGVGGTNVPVINPTPNQVVFNQLGIQIIFWQTNWDPSTGGLTDDGESVFTNALRITAPGGIDLTVSHSEASATCAGRQPQPPDPDEPDEPDVPEAPPADPVPGQPTFTG